MGMLSLSPERPRRSSPCRSRVVETSRFEPRRTIGGQWRLPEAVAREGCMRGCLGLGLGLGRHACWQRGRSSALLIGALASQAAGAHLDARGTRVSRQPRTPQAASARRGALRSDVLGGAPELLARDRLAPEPLPFGRGRRPRHVSIAHRGARSLASVGAGSLQLRPAARAGEVRGASAHPLRARRHARTHTQTQMRTHMHPHEDGSA